MATDLHNNHLFTHQGNITTHTCGMNIRRSCTMAWNQASTKSACEWDTLPDLLTYCGLQASNVRSKFFLTPGGAYTNHKSGRLRSTLTWMQ